MSAEQDSRNDATRDWDAYWQNAGVAPALCAGGARDAALDRSWSRLLQPVFARSRSSLRALDIGSGNGAVIRHLLRLTHESGRSAVTIALDAAPHALAELRRQIPEAHCVAADAARTPFPDHAFDLLTSQFGLEYAGAGAFTEAARLLGDGGTLAAILHLQDGGIERECRANLDAIDGFRSGGLLPAFAACYHAAWALAHESGAAADFQAAERRLSTAVAAADAVLRKYGPQAGGGTLLRIYRDVGHMHGRLGAYEPGELQQWIGRMTAELDAWAGRMAAMLDAALDEPRLETLLSGLRAAGFEIRTRERLAFDRARLPCAWIILAERP